MTYGERLTFRIDAAFQHQADEDGKRTHLGASIVGRKCLREVWLSFHWAGAEQNEGRMLRLFNRGHLEEERFANYLRLIGAEVWTHDGNGNQFRVSDHGGHFGGSLDGVARNLPDFPYGALDTPVLTEFKTHNDKSFKSLQKDGVKKSKPQHYNQAQVYMRGYGLKWCLYMGVNKNDDHLYLELFAYDEQVANYLHNRAETVLFGSGIPNRITSNPTWFECKFCDFAEVCWRRRLPDKNCRTCRYSICHRDGNWYCTNGQPEITSSPKTGCDMYEVNPDI